MLAKLTSKKQLTLPKAVTAAVEAARVFRRGRGERAHRAHSGAREPRRCRARQARQARTVREGRGQRGLLGAFGRMTRPRLVLDTNVLLSALLFPAGAVSWIRASRRTGRIGRSPVGHG